MATIPEARTGIMLPRGDGPRLDPGARGFRVNLGAVMDASRPALINERAFAVADAASIGGGLQDTGGAVMKIASEQLRLYNEQKVLEADGMMVTRSAEIANLIASEPDPRKWASIADREAMNSSKLWITDDLSPDARAAIEAKSMLWRNRLVAQTTRAGFEQTMQNVAGEYEKRRIQSVRAGDRDLAIQQVDDMERAGLIDPGRAERLRVETGAEVDASQKQSTYDAHFGALTSDPTGWKEANPEPWDGDEQLWQKLKNQADAREREVSAAAVDQVQEMIASGDLDVPEEIDIIRIPGLTPALRESLKADLLAFDKSKSDTEKRENGEKNWLEAWKKARAWEGGASDKSAQEYYDQMKWVRYGVPDDQQGKIAELLYRKMGLEAKVAPATEAVQAADKVLNSYWADGTFNGGKPMTRFDTVSNRDVTDQAAVRQSAGIEASVRQKVNNYLKQNPNTKPEEVPDIVRKMLPDGVRASMLRKLQSDLFNPQGPANTDAANTRPVDSSGFDLPTGDGDINPALLDQIPPFRAE